MVELRHRAKFRQKCPNRGRDMAFDFLRWRPPPLWIFKIFQKAILMVLWSFSLFLLLHPQNGNTEQRNVNGSNFQAYSSTLASNVLHMCKSGCAVKISELTELRFYVTLDTK